MIGKNLLIRIVDDDGAIRDSLSFLLETEGWVVATYDSAETFLTQDSQSIPGCLVLDIRMPGLNGMDLQEELIARGYELPIIFLTGHGTIDMAVRAIQHGAVDFLQKPIDNARFLATVKKALDRSITASSLLDIDPLEAIHRWNLLTDREKEVINKISEGKLNKYIARSLKISIRTVEHHRARSFFKLGVKNVAELNFFLSMLPENVLHALPNQ